MGIAILNPKLIIIIIFKKYFKINYKTKLKQKKKKTVVEDDTQTLHLPIPSHPIPLFPSGKLSSARKHSFFD
jgi:hypothetical protein